MNENIYKILPTSDEIILSTTEYPVKQKVNTSYSIAHTMSFLQNPQAKEVQFIVSWDNGDDTQLLSSFSENGSKLGKISAVSDTTSPHSVTMVNDILVRGYSYCKYGGSDTSRVGKMTLYSFNYENYQASNNRCYSAVNVDNNCKINFVNFSSTKINNKNLVVHAYVDTDGDGKGINAVILSDLEKCTNSPFKVNQYAPGDQYMPTISPTDQGFAIAWKSESQKEAVMMRAFNEDGTPLCSEFRVSDNDYPPADKSGAQIRQCVKSAKFDDGNIAIYWKEQDDFFIKVFDSGGTQVVLNTMQFNVAKFPIEADPSKNKVVLNCPTVIPLKDVSNPIVSLIWAGEGEDGTDLFSQVYLLAGAPSAIPISDITIVNDYTYGDQILPLALPTSAGFAVSWRDTTTLEMKSRIFKVESITAKAESIEGDDFNDITDNEQYIDVYGNFDVVYQPDVI